MSRPIRCKHQFPFTYWQRIIKLVGNPLDKKYTQSEIAEILELPKASVYKVLYDMEKAGFIVRVQEKGGIFVFLTARGRIIWKSLSDIENNIGYNII